MSKTVAGCAAATDELAASRTLIDALEGENAALATRLASEKRATELLTELNETRKSETSALRETVSAKTEAIAAKDELIASQDRLIATLKTRKSSIWKRLGDVMIGATVALVLK